MMTSQCFVGHISGTRVTRLTTHGKYICNKWEFGLQIDERGGAVKRFARELVTRETRRIRKKPKNKAWH